VPDQPPVSFLYALGQRLRHARRGWVGEVVQRRYTDRPFFGPVVEYLLEFPEGEVLWTAEPDVVPET
jgi:hypothetical protein